MSVDNRDIKCDFKIAGQKEVLQFNKLEVETELFDHCKIHLEIGFDRHQSKEVIDKAVNNWLGEELEIEIKDQINTEAKKKYKGIISGFNSKRTSMVLEAKSEDHKLALANSYKSSIDTSAFNIAKEVVETFGLKNNMSCSDSINFKFFQQYNESDYDCLKRLAKIDGCIFFNDGEEFVYGKEIEACGDLVLNLDDVKNVSMEAKINNAKWVGAPYDNTKHSEPSTLEKLSSDPPKGTHKFSTKILNKSKSTYGNVKDQLYNAPVVDNTFDKYMINQQKYAHGDNLKVKGTAFNPAIAIGRTLKVNDHDILEEKVVISKLKAKFEDNTYSAEFEAISPKTVVKPELEKEIENRTSIEQALVIDNADPEAMGRVMVQFLWDMDGSANAWARVVQRGAGKTGGGINYGTHYTPRVGDHVIVAFEGGDPSSPIVLGSVYHSENKPQFITNNGVEEALVIKTPQESKIEINDSGGAEEIVIAMKGDKNVIRLELTQPQITIESVSGTINVKSKDINITADNKFTLKAKDIDITATNTMKTTVAQNNEATIGGNNTLSVAKNYEISSGMKLTSTSGQDTEMKSGMNVKMQAGIKLEQSATMVESKAAAVNTIQGGIVKIN